MTQKSTYAGDNYSPLYFLAALGAGGLVVTFFMYLFFWVPHPGQPAPVFEDIARAWALGHTGQQAAIVVAMAGILFFAALHFRSLFWNIGQYRQFIKSPAGIALRKTNAETQITAMPLAMAMGVNGGFIIGMVFVPGLWSVVEYLFPVAMMAFLAIGVLTLRQMGGFLGRIMSEPGSFKPEANNSFAQLLPAFALSMVAVGLAAPSAMSTVPVIQGISLILSTFFGFAAIIWATIAAITAFNSILKHGAAKEAAPTLMVVIPMLTVLGIMFMRQSHGLHVSFDSHAGKAADFMFLTRFLSVQVLFGLLGMLILRRQNYGATYLWGHERSAGSYALVCPGVALSVLTHFWINKGLVANGILVKFSTAYWGLTAIALLFQFAMIVLVLYLNRKHFGRSETGVAVPAE